MKTVLDSLTSAAGWSVTGGASVVSDQWAGLTASGNTSSLKFVMPKNSTADFLFGQSGSGVDLAGGAFVAFNQKKNLANVEYLSPTDFELEALITWDNGSRSYYVPLSSIFDRTILRTEGAARIYQIRFTALKDVSFFASELISFTSQYPYDIYQGLNAALAPLLPPTVIGTVTAAPGDSKVKINNYSIIERFSVISFGYEMHQVDTFDQDGTVTFFPNYSGAKVQFAFPPNSPVSLLVPVKNNPDNQALTSPGVSIRGGFSPVVVQSGTSTLMNEWDTWNTDGSRYIGRKGATWEYSLQLDGFSMIHEMMELITRGIQDAFQSGFIWVNGLRVEWIDDGAPVYQDNPDTHTETYVQISHVFKFRIEEEMRSAVKSIDTLTAYLTAFPFIPQGVAL